ncbi:MAG: ATP-binding protein [Elusimicrobia bacterium]|nr:ATP-binding protein [Elusimicrobiota bacterium]
MIKRTLYLDLWQELASGKQMIFLSGPRQVGKTTFTKEIAKEFKNNVYFNWDIIENKKKLLQNPAFFETINRVDESAPLIILDEIHKYKNWKNYLKGIYDQFSTDYRFIISGSGRLDLFQKGGDSLAGRYFQLHLLPLTLAELSKKRRNIESFIKNPINEFDINEINPSQDKWDMLCNFGGFPEPFIKSSKTFLNRWSRTYLAQLLREDIRSLTEVKKVDDIEILFSLLPSRIGSPLSVNNLVSDTQVSYVSIKDWLNLFEKFYLTFRISPWTKRIARAILKEKKLYLYNYTEIKIEGYKFENMIALELLRCMYSWNEHGYGKFNLHYIRNKDKEEVDFLITENNNPMLLVETKYSDESVSKNLIKFQNELKIPAVQLVNTKNVFKYIKNNDNKILIVTAPRWLASLP